MQIDRGRASRDMPADLRVVQALTAVIKRLKAIWVDSRGRAQKLEVTGACHRGRVERLKCTEDTTIAVGRLLTMELHLGFLQRTLTYGMRWQLVRPGCQERRGRPHRAGHIDPCAHLSTTFQIQASLLETLRAAPHGLDRTAKFLPAPLGL